jgi:pimeloyl-ACP methyl ester carboxylesterase
VLIGHSMGGPVIVETARLAPDRIAALVSVDHFYDADRQPTEAQIEALIGPVRADFPGEIAALVRTFFTDRSDPALIDRISRDMASAPPEVGVSALGHVRRYDEAAGLAAVRAPMRMINADKWPTNLEAARRHKPDIQLGVMPGLGHFPFLEDPEEFNRLLARAVAETDRHHRRPDAFPAPPVASRREPRSRADSPHCG